MEIELLEINNFLMEYSPFSELPESVIKEISKNIEISYYREDTPIIHLGDYINSLFIVRSGAVEMYRRNGQLYDRLSEGDTFGQMGLLTNNRVSFPAKAISDTLVYCICEELFQKLYNEYDVFADFMEVEKSVRLNQVVTENREANDLTTSKVTEIIYGEPAVICKNESIQAAAEIMARDNIDSILVIKSYENNKSQDNIMGIITDRDMCTRVIAENRSPKDPVTSIMSKDIIVLDHNAYVYEAMLTMLRSNIHHLLILKNNYPLGIIEAKDILQHESQSSLLLVNQIFKQQNIEDLAIIADSVKNSFKRLVDEDANAHMIGSAMSVIGRSLKQRIIELAEEKLGKAPIPYCFMALGSMGRDEQLLITDQDNAIILSNKYNEEKHNKYFEDLAVFVCKNLALCGYKLCTGDVMATNKMWRMTQKEWIQHFSNWIDKPDPKALLNASIFFDLDGVYGEIKWAKELRAFIANKAKGNKKFLSCLARNALGRTPPLGFFKNFVVEKDGQNKKSIDLKRRGTAPLSDLIRVHALAAGSNNTNSFERLDDISDSNILPKGKAQDLRDAFEFISMVRIKYQAISVEAGKKPNNNIEPENLTDFERRNLKDAFQILSSGQNFLKFRY